MTEVAYQRLPARLATRLLELSNLDCIISGPGQQALAGVLGTYRESIGARLQGLRDAGALKPGHGSIESRDTTGLRTAAGGPVRISDQPFPRDGQATGTAEEEGIRR